MKRVTLIALLTACLSLAGCLRPPETVDFEIGMALGEFRADQTSGQAEMTHFVGEQLSHMLQMDIAARDREMIEATELASKYNMGAAATAAIARKYGQEIFRARDDYDYNTRKFGTILRKLRGSSDNVVDLLIRERAKSWAVRERVDAATRDMALRAATDILAAAQSANPDPEDEVEEEPEPEPEPTHGGHF